MGLGWHIEKTGEYKINLPILSDDEIEAIKHMANMFKEVTKYKELDNPDKAKKELKNLLIKFCDKEGIVIDKEQENYLTQMAFYNIYGFAGMEEILKDEEIEEIGIIGLGKPVYVFVRKQGWKKTNLYYDELDFTINLINKMSRSIGRRITYKNPRLNAVLPDGSRMHASIPPISNVEVTIRKFKENPMTVFDLLNYHTISEEAMALLWFLMQADISILITGNTASGKTTTMNSIFSFVPLNERILITEETPEINIPHKHVVKLVANQELDISLSPLVADSLRMRPDRVIVGEVRNTEEVHALMDTILSGQARGSYATFHAQSSKETLSRLRSLGVLEIDLPSIDIIVIQRRMMKYNVKTRKSEEIRRIVEIVEVDKNNPGKTTPLFIYDYEKDSWKADYQNSEILKRLSLSLGVPQKEMENEIKTRTEFLKKNIKKKWNFETAVNEIQKFAYGLSLD
ncbi:Flp pilus assembly complex ATPase component TadA [Candidatus Micrarchaeota archaeon]|nr:Flp pilus assembly complex ATPase component TadA [Candidatus Micrarchaeota archaeon]